MNAEFEMGRAMRGKEHPMSNPVIYRGWVHSTLIGIGAGILLCCAVVLWLFF